MFQNKKTPERMGLRIWGNSLFGWGNRTKRSYDQGGK